MTTLLNYCYITPDACVVINYYMLCALVELVVVVN